MQIHAPRRSQRDRSVLGLGSIMETITTNQQYVVVQ